MKTARGWQAARRRVTTWHTDCQPSMWRCRCALNSRTSVRSEAVPMLVEVVGSGRAGACRSVPIRFVFPTRAARTQVGRLGVDQAVIAPSQARNVFSGPRMPAFTKSADQASRNPPTHMPHPDEGMRRSVRRYTRWAIFEPANTLERAENKRRGSDPRPPT